MRPSERLKIISEIASELQSRFTYNEIDAYFAAFGVDVPTTWEGPNSKRVYSAEILGKLSDAQISNVADDLDIHIAASMLPLPRIWSGTTELRLFVSHISKDKDKAVRLRDWMVSPDVV